MKPNRKNYTYVMPRITELSVVAVTRDDLEQLHRDVGRYNANR